uniref:SCO-spondin-like n=1 Tax=Ciona intestinalis TaxID=7719 RepID=H2XX54_CIOIN|nr:SCO-spondin-like [Ciona intestinalis]|eukprot:XP_004226625.1 SCO-spondin-like [Ciona intestinalis]
MVQYCRAPAGVMLIGWYVALIVYVIIRPTASHISCPGNQIYSDCAGCDVACNAQRHNVICTSECRQKCTCQFPSLYMSGDQCITDQQCAILLGETSYKCYLTSVCDVNNICCGDLSSSTCCPTNNICCRNGTTHTCSNVPCAGVRATSRLLFPILLLISLICYLLT